jgi:adenine/guanine phosphoribosyltransferase-like PRPP-binding protein
VSAFEIRDVGEGFELTIQVEVAKRSYTVKDITLLAYAKTGTEVARHSVGTLDESRPRAVVTTECTGFPAIITAEAATAVCQDVNLPIMYLKSPATATENRTWEQDYRECGEGLPPERILERYRTESPTQK